MISKQESKELILETAANLFEKYGYNNVRISDITQEIGLTTGFFYYHFRGKEQTLQLIYENYISSAADMVNEIYHLENMTALEKLEILIKKHCKIIKENHAQVSVFFREYRNLSPEGLLIIQEKNKTFLQYVENIINQGIEESQIKDDVNAKMVSLAIIGMCNWIYQWYKDNKGFNIEEIGDIFFRLVTNGLVK